MNDYAEVWSSSDNGSDGESTSSDGRSIDASEGFGFDSSEESSSSDSHLTSIFDKESSYNNSRSIVHFVEESISSYGRSASDPDMKQVLDLGLGDILLTNGCLGSHF